MDVDPCEICEDENRERRILCVVEEPLDVLAIERTGRFLGRYHVLHGALAPVEGIGPEDLKIEELVRRIETEEIEELILERILIKHPKALLIGENHQS